MIGAEGLVMDYCMRTERIDEWSHRPMHDVAVNSPFKEGTDNAPSNCRQETEEK